MHTRARTFACQAVLAAAVLCGLPASANPYLWVSGLKGEAAAPGYEGWIDIESYSLSVTGKSCRGVRVVKRVDGVSETFFVAASRGTVFDEARFDVDEKGGKTGLVRLRLQNAVVSSVQLSTNAAGETIETLQLAAALVIVEFQPGNAGNDSLRTSTESRMACKNVK